MQAQPGAQTFDILPVCKRGAHLSKGAIYKESLAIAKDVLIEVGIQRDTG